MAVAVPGNLLLMATTSIPILLLVDRGDVGHHGLNKAMLLARHMRAPLELYLCEVSPLVRSRDSPERAAQLAELQAAARAYLHALRLHIFSTDVEIRYESQVTTSWADGLNQRLQRAAVLLVITPVGAQITPDPRVALDWSLLQSCTAPLLLTRKRAWKPVPRFGAAIDLGAGADDELGARLIGLAEQLTRACSALLEYLYVAVDEGEATPVYEAWRRLAQLAGVAKGSVGSRGWLRYHAGRPREQLPSVVGERGYDLLMMGWPRRRDGTLTSFINDDAAPSALGAASPRHAAPLEENRRTSVRLLRAADGDLLLLPAVSSADQTAVAGRAGPGAL